MALIHVFADEAGCFTFERKPNVSSYFILCTVLMEDCSIGSELLSLRRRLAWEGKELGEYFHASTDKQVIRDAVFSEIVKHDFRIQYTLMEKAKAQPQIKQSVPRFYQHGWFYHFKFGVSRQIPSSRDTLVTAASIGTRREKAAFLGAIDDVMSQTMPAGQWRTDFCPAASDPCIQVADYCAWAIQRKYERGDDRAYDLIKERISYRYDLWARGTTLYY